MSDDANWDGVSLYLNLNWPYKLGHTTHAGLEHKANLLDVY